jgi:hypothetical protein
LSLIKKPISRLDKGIYVNIMRSKCSWESYRMQVAKKNKRKKPDGPAKGSKSVGFG